MVIKRVREASPLWVWIAVALLVFGATVYAGGVAILEYFMASAG
jgi:hypothetical protein